MTLDQIVDVASNVLTMCIGYAALARKIDSIGGRIVELEARVFKLERAKPVVAPDYAKVQQ